MSMHHCSENANSPVPSPFEGCSTFLPIRIAGTDELEIPTTVAEDFDLELAGQQFDPCGAHDEFTRAVDPLL